ncbi:GtrA family protein [Aquibacillus rhizosphaerae]|uniref:GtrA family protein n=1 Tax=Aquibacillus rhizosphaerae TaxID=3051431 RepID=A0ABT7L986_9BACI|nr:GtrA family protein [Aquibacillus sp. LR5S19]MDL4841792.1 GtrA family protein [Aquibacillus sp. LR5S19]
MIFSRFLLVGIINTFVGLTTMYILLYTGMSYWTSTALGNAVGACTSYLLNKTFTFRSTLPVQHTVIRYLAVICVCYVIAYAIGIRVATQIIQSIAEVPLLYVEDIAILIGAAMYTLLNYFGQKRFVFLK